MQGLALRGFHTGGRCFGYKSVKLEDSSARLEIDRAEAEIINRIYRLYAESGYSMKRIAHTLNAEGVLAPQPQKGRFSRSWCVSSVRHILLNTRYTGKTTWNTRRKIRVPGTGKRVFRPRPRTEWVISETPHLRIVTDELATAVRRRLQTVKQMFGKDDSGLASGPKRYLFSGLLKCGVCGGSIALVCGRGRHGADRYGCSLHHQRGDSVCRNRLLVRRDELEESLLRGLSESVLRSEVIDYAVSRMEEALRKRFEELDAELEQLRRRKQQIEAEIARLIHAIADGQGSQSITGAIGERERELRSITDKLLEPRPGSLRSTLDELRTFAVSRPHRHSQANRASREHRPGTGRSSRTLRSIHARTRHACWKNHVSCSRQSRFLRSRSDGANGWCRGPESNWLRPPFQGGALPVSYPGTLESVNFRGASKLCQITPLRRGCADSTAQHPPI